MRDTKNFPGWMMFGTAVTFWSTVVLAWAYRREAPDRPAPPTPVAVVDLAESSHVFRAPLRELLNPENRRTVVYSRRGFTGRSPGFVLPEATVWGFTGILLDSVLDGLGWTEPWDASLEIPPPR